jgi:hypothetical protein
MTHGELNDALMREILRRRLLEWWRSKVIRADRHINFGFNSTVIEFVESSFIVHEWYTDGKNVNDVAHEIVEWMMTAYPPE